ncbi:hypothetical protein D3OALGA1CA_3095 [Olavius algarvensis associated proteobacterium Delta 3]|nr:hypothetical protein D3OALGA1CA_3095 [Olavius algarvensis associated proteobacterium Delta 3]
MLIRDAEIELSQPGVSTSDKNVGFAPLIFFSGEYAFAKRWTGILDFDGLAGGPGRAGPWIWPLRSDTISPIGGASVWVTGPWKAAWIPTTPTISPG